MVSKQATSIVKSEQTASEYGYALKVSVNGEGRWTVTLRGDKGHTAGREFSGQSVEQRGVASSKTRAYSLALGAAVERMLSFEERIGR